MVITVIMAFLPSISMQVKLTSFGKPSSRSSVEKDIDFGIEYEEDPKSELEGLLEERYEKIMEASTMKYKEHDRRLNKVDDSHHDANNSSFETVSVNESMEHPVVSDNEGAEDHNSETQEAINFSKTQKTTRKPVDPVTSIIIDSHGHELLKETFAAIDTKSQNVDEMLTQMAPGVGPQINNNSKQSLLADSHASVQTQGSFLDNISNNESDSSNSDSPPLIRSHGLLDVKNPVDEEDDRPQGPPDEKTSIADLSDLTDITDSTISSEQDSSLVESHIDVSPTLVLEPNSQIEINKDEKGQPMMISEIHDESKDREKTQESSEKVEANDNKADDKRQKIVQTKKNGDIVVETREQVSTIQDKNNVAKKEVKEGESGFRIAIIGILSLLILI